MHGKSVEHVERGGSSASSKPVALPANLFSVWAAAAMLETLPTSIEENYATD